MDAHDAFREFEQAGWTDDALARAYHQQLADVTRQSIPRLLAAVGLKAGDRALDVACGSGYVAAAARECGADVVGLDFSVTQIRLARQAYPGIEFTEGDAEALPFSEAQFDVVLNAFGFPHFPNPDKAAAEAWRVLRPAGRFAYVSWASAPRCVAVAMLYDAIRAHGSFDVGLPPGPDFFSYGDPAYATELLRKAGFARISTGESPAVWRVSSTDGLYQAMSAGTVRAAAVLRRQSPEALSRIRQALREGVARFESNGIYEMPAPALVVAAERVA
jgi:ubiquinone/menaquinone biosynthesis C-methylase UbiE